MANSRFAYVRDFEQPDRLLPRTFIVLRIDGHAFRQCPILFTAPLLLRAHPNYTDSPRLTTSRSPMIIAASSLWIKLQSVSWESFRKSFLVLDSPMSSGVFIWNRVTSIPPFILRQFSPSKIHDTLQQTPIKNYVDSVHLLYSFVRYELENILSRHRSSLHPFVRCAHRTLSRDTRSSRLLFVASNR